MQKNFKYFPFERQLESKDCGPACIKMIARYYSKYYTLQYLRDLCGNTREGVSFYDISYAAEAIGFRSLALNMSLEDLRDKVRFPVIIHWEKNHFVVVYAIRM